ncbi:hypothetical protein BDQ12DRAFT_668345 [Crucibulum laeve]|uniref:Uncharacterized protein n=1 Tax=Crucibulum laeve TaxID=68775 RepID=A0A5C3LUT2_9AGAR|nr:hypothetical protein BDQ12DRAFT_668345 [Crucibulum laeve]
MSPLSHTGCRVLDAAQQDETRQAWLLGASFCGLGYGVVSTIYYMCFYLLRQSTRSNPSTRRQNSALLVYITAMYLLGTSAFAFDILATIHGVFKGTCTSPNEMPVDPYFGKTDICYALINWGADGLLAWRCWIIYSGTGVSPWIFMSFPAALLSASVGIGIPMVVYDYHSRTPTVDLILQIWGAITISINLVITSMIAIRIYLHRRRISKSLGSGHASEYTSVIAMLIESAALVVVFDFFFLVAFSLGWVYGNIAFQTWIQVQAIAPFLIIFRVAQGKAWSRKVDSDSMVIPPSLESNMIANQLDLDNDRFSITFAPGPQSKEQEGSEGESSGRTGALTDV